MLFSHFACKMNALVFMNDSPDLKCQIVSANSYVSNSMREFFKPIVEFESWAAKQVILVFIVFKSQN